MQIHRFRDKVAISFDGTDTIYLSHEQADKIGDYLKYYAEDVELVKFTQSKAGTNFVTEEN